MTWKQFDQSQISSMFKLVRFAAILLVVLLSVSYGETAGAKITSVAISPNGKLVVLSFEKGENSFVYRVDVNTGKASRLTRTEAGTEFGPVFSPDGKLIAFSYRPGGQAHSTIVIGNPDGSDLRTWSPPEASDLSPVFSPDNKTIVFSRSGFFGSYSPIAQPHPHEWSFYASDLDGSHVRELTNESFYMASPPSVSPDGRSMVVVTEGLDTNSRIAVYSIIHPGPPTQTTKIRY